MDYTKKLTEAGRREFARRLAARRRGYEAYLRGAIDERRSVLLIGDRPGPRAPQTDDYHHTPFYSNFMSGGWVTLQLQHANIDEDRLLWVNSATWDNKPADASGLKTREWRLIVALGNNAAKWARQNSIDAVVVNHPQYHRRFQAGQKYPLIDRLTTYFQDEARC